MSGYQDHKICPRCGRRDLDPLEECGCDRRVRNITVPFNRRNVPTKPAPDLAQEVLRLREENELLAKERNNWRQAMQRLTPGGSEFTTPKACEEWGAMLRTELHNAKCDRVRSQRRAEAAEAKLREIAGHMITTARRPAMTEAASEKLEPCPFCGHAAESCQNRIGWNFWVECENCGVRTGSSGNRDVAIAAWNRRAQPEAAAPDGWARECAKDVGDVFHDGIEFKPTHRHYKGGLYQKLFSANHSETKEELVAYRSEDGRFWVRPWSMYHGRVRQGNDDVLRFEPLAHPTPPKEATPDTVGQQVSESVYLSAVQGRKDFRDALRAAHAELAEIRDVLAGTDTASLPHDRSTIQLAKDRMADLQAARGIRASARPPALTSEERRALECFQLIQHSGEAVWLLMRADPENKVGAGSVRLEGEFAQAAVRAVQKRDAILDRLAPQEETK